MLVKFTYRNPCDPSSYTTLKYWRIQATNHTTMPLHIGLPYGQRSQQTQEATRDAKRQLTAKVQANWDYPDAPHPNTHTSGDAKAAVNAHVDTTQAANASSLDFSPVAWKERQYSDVESSEEEPVTPRKKTSFRFDSPDSVGHAISARKASRKRKRQVLLEEEMGWNVGLAHFSARRNAWTGARLATDNQDAMDIDTSGRSSTSSPMRSSHDITKTPYPDPAIAEDANVLLPVAPLLLPDHPVRKRINTSSYAEIYSKVIVQSRTPTVPINLQDCTNALVYGWKESGEWPPKGADAEPSVTKKKPAPSSLKHPHLKKSVQVVSKVFGLSSPASSNSHG